jgi:hypothetical protein
MWLALKFHQPTFWVSGASGDDEKDRMAVVYTAKLSSFCRSDNLHYPNI